VLYNLYPRISILVTIGLFSEYHISDTPITSNDLLEALITITLQSLKKIEISKLLISCQLEQHPRDVYQELLQLPLLLMGRSGFADNWAGGFQIRALELTIKQDVWLNWFKTQDFLIKIELNLVGDEEHWLLHLNIFFTSIYIGHFYACKHAPSMLQCMTLTSSSSFSATKRTKRRFECVLKILKQYFW